LVKNNKKKKKLYKKIIIILFCCVSTVAIVYSVSHYRLVQLEKESSVELMNKMKKMLDDEKKRLDLLPKVAEKKEPKKPSLAIVEKEIEKETHLSEVKDYKESLNKEIKKSLHVKKKTTYSGKPKLAIVIDDVAYAHQTRLIKKIPYKVTPSFFPPTPRHPDTVRLSKEFGFAMIHLPTEAISFGRPEPETLKISHSTEQIRDRIKQIKKWFPTIAYYNNHTGSKFTADYQAVDRLISVMRMEGLHFVDSRTTAKTQAPQVAKKYGLKLYSRDIFIDNSIEKKLIKEQLKKAVKIAKKRGYAMAIGHPHVNTLNVLIDAEDILEGIELVYLKDL